MEVNGEHNEMAASPLSKVPPFVHWLGYLVDTKTGLGVQKNRKNLLFQLGIQPQFLSCPQRPLEAWGSVVVTALRY